MKKRRGSTLVLTIIVFVILMVLSTALLNVMVTNSKQAVMHRDKIQAYYIARSGAEIAEAAIMQMSGEQIEELEGKENINFSITESKLEFGVGSLDSVTISREEDNKNNLIITSKASVKEMEETVIKVMGKDPSNIGEDSGGYRGVIKKYDTIDYLGEASENMPLIQDSDVEGYKLIDGRKYKIIGKDDFENDFKKNELEGNYYLDFDFEKKYKSLDLKIENVNIYTTGEFEVEAKSIDIGYSSIISEDEIEFETEDGDINIKDTALISFGTSRDKEDKDDDDGEIEIETNGGNIYIYNSTLISYGEDVEVEVEKGKGNIFIEKSVLKGKEEVEIEVKNSNIYIEDVTIVAGDREKKGEVEIEVKNGNITIKNSVIKSRKEIEMEMKSGNGAMSLEESTLLSEGSKDGKAIELEIKQAKKIEFKKSALISTESKKIIIGHEDYNHGIEIDKETIGVGEIEYKMKNGKISGEIIKKTMKKLRPIEDLPGMPRNSTSSDKGERDSIYQPGYYKKED